MLSLVGVETEEFLDYQGRAGIISILRWNLRPVIFGVHSCFLQQLLKVTRMGSLPGKPSYRARKTNKHKHFWQDGVQDKQEPSPGQTGTRPWDKLGPVPGTNWDPSLGQIGRFLLNSTVNSPFCSVCPCGTIVPQGPSEKCLCVLCLLVFSRPLRGIAAVKGIFNNSLAGPSIDPLTGPLFSQTGLRCCFAPPSVQNL